jgi:hypothetical protein
MPKKPETKLSNQVLPRLRAEGGWWVKIHGGPFQAIGIPDIVGCWKGRFVGIELKIPGEKPSGIQQETMDLLYLAGARVGLATTVEEALSVRDGKNDYTLFRNRG